MASRSPREKTPRKILVVDVGGSKVKVLATGEHEPRKAPSGKRFTPAKMIEVVRALTKGWKYDAVSLGFPGLVGSEGPRSETSNLGPGWVGFDYSAAFGRPVRIINDAAMQALGSYDGGRMLFLGLGTGLGSALIAENIIVTLELGRLRIGSGKRLGDLLGRSGLAARGKSAWRKAVCEAVAMLSAAFDADYVVVGGGNAKKMDELPPGARRGHNNAAFRGGFRLWNIDDVATLPSEDAPEPRRPLPKEWRLI